ncbi:type II toxin-antitoxin system HicA family toxin [bacterium]|nr:type II toxin-antitoxin system HicA family toxin [bacterium]
MSPQLPVVTGVELIRAFQRAGYSIVRQTGSHTFLAHPRNPRHLVNIPAHKKDMKPSTLRSILFYADVSVEELLTWL